jgi:hypothetical protein
MRSDDPAAMAKMREWLRSVSAEVEVDPDLMRTVEVPLLDLISVVAHGPSRPGAPLTAFLIGVAAGRGGSPTELTERVSTLAKNYEVPDGSQAN